MSRPKPTTGHAPADDPAPTDGQPLRETPPAREPRRRTWLVVAALLALHYGLAASSLVGENPTVDEVLHLPAGVSYWQTGSFRLYRHNPPLVKLVAALPVLAMRPETAPIYRSLPAWRAEYPSQATFGQYFAALNAGRFLEMYRAARLVMPLWSVVGGLVVFAWSRRLFGDGAGLLSLALWCLCPNVLAHGRLVTSDVAAASLGVLATFAFWLYLDRPTWSRAAVAGVCLGLALLVKFSSLLLLALWPVLWVVTQFSRRRDTGFGGRIVRAVGHAAVVLAVAVLVVDAGYLFEGVGTPLGKLPFASRSILTREGAEPRVDSDASGNPLIDASWRHRVNRFRGTWLGALPSPLPRHFLLGFDEQKIEADGIPQGWLDPTSPEPEKVTGYPVYLDGQLRRTGWREYYLKTLLYKVPEGTWALVALAVFVWGWRRWGLASGRDAVAVWLPPLAVLGAMSLLTDINLGLRYVLPLFPYVFVACGIVVPWARALSERLRPGGAAVVVTPLLATAAATLTVHPHYLAFFNAASGGPRNGAAHLIDSNLDWGQDLVGLREWVRSRLANGPIGVAYFGQVPPQLFAARGDGFRWFVPPAIPGRIAPMNPMDPAAHAAPATRLEPGFYAVSASLVRGLPWRLYAPDPVEGSVAWVAPGWRADAEAFAYFRELQPLPETIGHSILIYLVRGPDARRINAKYFPDAGPGALPPAAR